MNFIGRLVVFLFNLAIVLAVSLFVIGVVKDFTSSDWLVGGVGLVTFGIVAWYIWGFSKESNQENFNQKNQSMSGEEIRPMTIPWWQTEGRPYRFIFTHDEEALDAIELDIANHPKVRRVFQDEGFWYTNGETGPAWFSMHVICNRKDSDELQEFVKGKLKEKNYPEHVSFVGDNN